MNALQSIGHYAVLALPFVLALLPSLITALTPYPKADGAVKVLKQILNMVSVLTHSDSPGTLKLPLTMSKPPAGGQ